MSEAAANRLAKKYGKCTRLTVLVMPITPLSIRNVPLT